MTSFTIRSFRTRGADDPEIEFAPRHVAATRDAEGRTMLWTLLVPDRPPPPNEKFLGYVVKHGPDPKGPLAASSHAAKEHPFAGGMVIEHAADFDTFVLGVMAQMSADGKPPEGLTYARVAGLTREPTPPNRPRRADPAGL